MGLEMKKILFGVIFICFLLVLPINNVSSLEKIQTNKNSHTVIVEFCTIGSSLECSIASNQLYDVYSSGIFDFYYITLSSDENEVTNNRLQELGISEFPNIVFDGGYKIISGNQSNGNAYSNAIAESISRDTAPIELHLYSYWTSSPCYPMINSEIVVYNDGNDEYNGRLQLSVVEIDSRWKDTTGRPYNYALLDYALIEDFTIEASLFGAYSVENTWFPNVDACGVPADPNLLVIATVFSKETGFADATAVSRLVEGDQPIKPNNPDGPSYVEMGVEYGYTTLSSDPDGEKVRYGVDWEGDYFIDEWTDFYESGEEVTITHVWNEKGRYNVRIKAMDETNLQSFWSEPLTVSLPKNKIKYFYHFTDFLSIFKLKYLFEGGKL
jgi:hypothetical protein